HAELLASRHGLEAIELLEKSRGLAGSPSSQPSSDDIMWAAEVRHAIHQTMCLGLVDFYVRRSPLFLSRADHGLPLLPLVSRVFAHDLNWSDSKRHAEMSAVQTYIREELGWKQKFGIKSSSF
ncbi:MAG: hypothetical protein EOP05_08010, partial [Proteobacteria bacterium]